MKSSGRASRLQARGPTRLRAWCGLALSALILVVLLGTLSQCSHDPPTMAGAEVALQIQIIFPDETGGTLEGSPCGPHGGLGGNWNDPAAGSTIMASAFDFDSIRVTALELAADASYILRASATVALADSATHFCVPLEVPAADLYRVIVVVFGARGADENRSEHGALYSGEAEVEDVRRGASRSAIVKLSALVPKLSAFVEAGVGYNLQWTAIQGALHYRLREIPTRGQPRDFVTTATDTFIEFSVAAAGAAPGITGFGPRTEAESSSYRVRAELASLAGAFSESVSVQFPEPEPPGCVIDLSVTDVGGDFVALAWTAPGEGGYTGQAAAYDLRYTTGALTAETFADATQVAAPPAPAPAGSAEAFDVVGLQSETTYNFALKTQGHDGLWSEISSIATATTLDVTAPAAVTDLQVANVGVTSAVLTWTAPGDDGQTGQATSYDLRCSTGELTAENFAQAEPISGLPVPAAAGTSEQVTVAGLSAGTTYQFALKTADEAGNVSGISPVVSATCLTACTITVLSPGGEGAPGGSDPWIDGSDYEITWQSAGACGDSVRIELLLEGEPCLTITPGTENDGAFSWTAARCQATSGYTVQIADLASGVTGESDNTFSIETYVPPCALAVTSPIGGELWTTQEEYEITWSHSGACGDSVCIELLEGGVVCSTITSGTENDDSFTWTATRCDGTSGYAIRITDLASGSSDESDGTFAMEPYVPPCSIDVIFPNSGETLTEYSVYDITWSHSGACGDSVKIELLHGDTPCATLTGSTPNSGSFSWMVQPCEQFATDYRIQITDLTSGASDASDAAFTIDRYQGACNPTVTAPNGGEVWFVDRDEQIAWSMEGLCGPEVRIELLRGGQTCLTIADSAANSGSFSWSATQCNTQTDGYAIRVTDLGSGNGDTSNQPFRIVRECTLAIAVPATGDAFCVGDTVAVSWNHSGDCGAAVIIDLLRDGELCEVIASAAANDGAYTWTAAQCGGASSSYTIRISDPESDATAVSGAFEVNAGCAMAVTAPSGGDLLCPGVDFEIRWDHFPCCGATVLIELLHSGAVCSTIAAVAANDGAYAWQVTPCAAGTDGYAIRMSDPTSGVFAESASFSIGAACGLAVTAPQEAEAFCAGDEIEIGWDANACCDAMVSIELLVSGFVYHTIAAATPNDGAFTWPAELHGSGQDVYNIRVAEVSGDASAESGYIFIDSECRLAVTAPRTADIFCEGDSVAIGWNSGICCDSLVDIELTRNGYACQTIVSGVPNIGSYSWMASRCGSSTSGYQIRVSETGGASFAESGSFQITPGCSIQLAVPNGGEFYCAGDSVPISWDYSGCCGTTVGIELLHEGDVCQVIQQSAGNTGVFHWIAQQCFAEESGYTILVTDLESGAFDNSDQSFDISEACSLQLTYPIEPEIFYIGEMIVIRWNRSDRGTCCGPLVKLELVRAGAVCLTIVDPWDNIGLYPWEAMPCGLDSTDYRIRVTDLGTLASDQSPEPFVIRFP